MSRTPPGRMVEVDGVPMHVLVEGTGTPTVVLESGLGGTVLDWDSVARALSSEMRVVRRDRPGFAWSPTADRPRDGAAAARELRAALTAADVAGPYLLVGHSLGGLYVRAFAHAYPDDVCGVVLVDATTESLFAESPGLRRMHSTYAAVLRTLARTGRAGTALLQRLEPRSVLAQLPPELHRQHLPLLALARELDGGQRLAALAAEQSSVATTCEQMSRTTFPPVPLVVLSHGRPASNARAEALMARTRAAHATQALALTPQGKHRIVADSGHLIPLEQPQAVVEAVRDVLRCGRSA